VGSSFLNSQLVTDLLLSVQAKAKEFRKSINIWCSYVAGPLYVHVGLRTVWSLRPHHLLLIIFLWAVYWRRVSSACFRRSLHTMWKLGLIWCLIAFIDVKNVLRFLLFLNKNALKVFLIFPSYNNSITCNEKEMDFIYVWTAQCPTSTYMYIIHNLFVLILMANELL